ncbi:phosphatidylinositol transfer protein 1-like isoform X1 [Ipomoea triloba]|uniref:phosphatidylinositol transfer protein 1-like isoform X1 n=2 Tax=Ipomoea triloba TaxID=35885 RepID=UPI00125DA8BC|nr:phosphatidylinositol transfer protein 1-like isoform X1 [Ipomoea triloba]
MVVLKEFRIVMPLSIEEYHIAQMFMVMKMQQQNTTGNEGVEILENRPFEDDGFGQGQYTSKIYRLQSKAPTWLTKLAPEDALVMQEEAWNAYPMCKSVIKCPYFTRFLLTIDTIHKADNGQSENVHGLSEAQLAAREVEIIDIASGVTDYWSYIIGRNDIDLSKFQSARTGRGPLLEGWKDNCAPVMTAYKLVTVDAPYWGFGGKLERALVAGEGALFMESHRNIFAWIDDWYGMTVEMMRELEQQSDLSLNKKLGRYHSNDKMMAQE